MEYKDYYAILGVARDADEATIKSAYRRLARTYHPDVNPDKEMAERRFKEINEAYTVLSDGEKRKLYDSFGSQWDGYQRAGVRPEDMGAGWPGWATRSGGMGQRRRQTYTRTMSSEEFAQIFETLFGTAYGGRSGRSSGSEFSDFFDALFGGAWRSATMQPSRGQDVEMAVPVTLAEAYTGTTRILQRGNGRRLEATVPAGVDTGTRIRLQRQGTPGYGGGPAGDLFLNVQVQPLPGVARRGDDLHMELPIGQSTASKGGTVKVPTPGDPVELKVPAGTVDGQVLRVAGQGMPSLRRPGQRGDLLVQVAVTAKVEAHRQRWRLGSKLHATTKQEKRSDISLLTALRRLVIGGGLVSIGVMGLLWQIVGLNGAGWLLLPALALLLWGAFTRSWRSAAVGGGAFLLAVLLLNADQALAFEVARWAWPLAALGGGAYLALRSGLVKLKSGRQQSPA